MVILAHIFLLYETRNAKRLHYGVRLFLTITASLSHLQWLYPHFSVKKHVALKVLDVSEFFYYTNHVNLSITSEMVIVISPYHVRGT